MWILTKKRKGCSRTYSSIKSKTNKNKNKKDKNKVNA